MMSQLTISYITKSKAVFFFHCVIKFVRLTDPLKLFSCKITPDSNTTFVHLNTNDGSQMPVFSRYQFLQS
jgi:hypothetical protein